MVDNKVQQRKSAARWSKSVAAKFRNKYLWLRNPLVLLSIGGFVGVALDILLAPFFVMLLLSLLGIRTDVQIGQDDLGVGATVMGLYIAIAFVTLPVWLWVCIRKVFNLFAEE